MSDRPQTTQDDTLIPEAESPGAEVTDAQIDASAEALLLMAEEPMPAATLAEVIGVPVPRISECLIRLHEFYERTGRGFELRHLGGGWRYYTRADQIDVLTRYVLDGQQSRLSQAALETLAVIAYLQPISRSRVSAVRGVNVDGVVRTLVARGLIEQAGQDEQSAAVVFRTTDYFLERMGIVSLSELPDLAPHLPEVAELEAELGQLAQDEGAGPAAENPPAPDEQNPVPQNPLPQHTDEQDRHP